MKALLKGEPRFKSRSVRSGWPKASKTVRGTVLSDKRPAKAASAAGTALALLATAAMAAGTDWTTSGHDLGGQRYSPLTQISASNVAKLEVAWTYHMTPVGYAGRPRLVESIPIVVGNHMYVASSYGDIVSLNATTGAEEWKFTIPDKDTPSPRGLAYWAGAPASVVFGTRLGRMYSLDAKSGKLNTGFGDHGMVNLKTPEIMVTGMRAVPAAGL